MPLWNKKYTAYCATRNDGVSVKRNYEKTTPTEMVWTVTGPTGTDSVSLMSFQVDGVSGADWSGGLDRAIANVDALYRPEGWKLTNACVWSIEHDGVAWFVAPAKSGHVWYVSRDGTTLPRFFPTADRARDLVDVLSGRVPKPNRGPRARAGKTATVVLPDVRVTVEERDAATSFAKGLGVSYADMMRAGLEYLRSSVLDTKNVTLVRRHDTDTVVFTDTMNLYALNGKPALADGSGNYTHVTVLNPSKES
jgi:hypothetical protein